MEEFDKIEERPAPVPVIEEFSDCSYFCFYIDPSIYEKDGFILNSQVLSFKEYKINSNLIVYNVHFGMLLNTFKLFKSTSYFKISYKYKKKQIFDSNFDFPLEKNKIKFIYDAGKKGSISSSPKQFKNPSCLEQYNAFFKVSQNYDILFNETKNFLHKTLDIELFLYLLQKKKDKKDELMSILADFPYSDSTIQYEKNKSLQKIDFSFVSKHKYYKKIVLIYSLIQDSTELLKDFNEDDISLFIIYNETQKDQPILIKKNIFEFFISKLNDEK